jgi:hypothetical protein
MPMPPQPDPHQVSIRAQPAPPFTHTCSPASFKFK